MSVQIQYRCHVCAMEVAGLTCGKCQSALVHDHIDVDGKSVGVSKCPNGCGMIKSPQCCGHDMNEN